MFGKSKKAGDHEPGEFITPKKTGKTVKIIAKGNGKNVGVTNGGDSWVISGDTEVE